MNFDTDQLLDLSASQLAQLFNSEQLKPLVKCIINENCVLVIEWEV